MSKHLNNNLLTASERSQLEAYLLNETHYLRHRRAMILLLYDDGLPTRLVAKQSGASSGRARFWRRQFRQYGLGIIKDLPQSEPSQVAAQDAALEAAQDEPVEIAGLPLDSLTEVPAPEMVAASETGGKKKSGHKQQLPSLVEFTAQAAQLPGPGVLPDDPLSEAGRKLWRYQFAQMLLHEDGTRRGEDIEALHDMRVATRRMRAAFEVFEQAFEPKSLKMHLKGLRLTGRALGQVRDLDVFLEKAQSYQQGLPVEQQNSLAPLMEAWHEKRTTARIEMQAFLDSERYQKFVQQFYEFLSTPYAGALKPTTNPPSPNRVCDVVPALIYSRLAAVRAFGAYLDTLSLEGFHALRIEFKKLRYTVEYFREVLGPEAKNVINEIKGVQDHLGDLNDAQVASQILKDFLAEWDARQAELPVSARLGPEPLLAYLSYRYHERQRLMVTFKERWERFNRVDFYQDLAQAIAIL